MKNSKSCLGGMMVFMTSPAYAAPAAEGAGVSFLGYLFLGFFALIIVSQLVPAGLLFYGMVKGVLTGRHDQVEAGDASK